jgi:hypothetical protein
LGLERIPRVVGSYVGDMIDIEANKPPWSPMRDQLATNEDG